jgi:hypothetical protein
MAPDQAAHGSQNCAKALQFGTVRKCRAAVAFRALGDQLRRTLTVTQR